MSAPPTPPAATAAATTRGAKNFRDMVVNSLGLLDPAVHPCWATTQSIGPVPGRSLGNAPKRRNFSGTAIAQPFHSGPRDDHLHMAAHSETDAWILVVDDEANITDLVATALRYEGFDVEVAGTGTDALQGGRDVPARPHGARRHAPRPRRLRRRAAAARRRPPRAGRVPDRARLHRGEGQGPDGRRRRLRHQAVQPRGARRPRARRAAPDRRATNGDGSARLEFADLELDDDTHEVWRGRDTHRADADRVQAAALPHAQRPPGALEGADPRPRVGVRLRRRRQRRRDLHQLPAQEDRQARTAADPYRSGAWATHCGRLPRAERRDAARAAAARRSSRSPRSGSSSPALVTYRRAARRSSSTASTSSSRRRRSPSCSSRASGGRDADVRAALLPPGTYGAGPRRRTATVVAATNPGSSAPTTAGAARPTLAARPTFTRATPALPRARRARDVPRRDRRRPSQSAGTLVVAIPLADVDHTLHHLLLVELLVALGVLARARAASRGGSSSSGCGRSNEMETTAGAIAAGDLSRRVERRRRAHRGRAARPRAQRDARTRSRRAFAERAASEARLRRFVADASHELRTPLTSIRGYAELFRRGAADRPEDLAKAMRRIEEEADRMGVLVDDLLLLARLDQGRPLERQPVDLTQHHARRRRRRRAPSRPTARSTYAPNGAVVVPGDEVRLRQVLANLLQNARTHTPPDTPGARARRERRRRRGHRGRRRGPGHAARGRGARVRAVLARRPVAQRASGGAGLGLAIVAAIADAHGGTAEVASTPGEGATFRVHLPRTCRGGRRRPTSAGLDEGPYLAAKKSNMFVGIGPTTFLSFLSSRRWM